MVDYAVGGFRPPEMVKPRLAVVLSPKIRARPGLCTVVPLSLTPPKLVMPYHYQLVVPFDLPDGWGNSPRWVKGDMVCAVGLFRVNLLRLGKDVSGRRRYQTEALPADLFAAVQKCILHGLGMSKLTGHL